MSPTPPSCSKGAPTLPSPRVRNWSFRLPAATLDLPAALPPFMRYMAWAQDGSELHGVVLHHERKVPPRALFPSSAVWLPIPLREGESIVATLSGKVGFTEFGNPPATTADRSATHRDNSELLRLYASEGRLDLIPPHLLRARKSLYTRLSMAGGPSSSRDPNTVRVITSLKRTHAQDTEGTNSTNDTAPPPTSSKRRRVTNINNSINIHIENIHSVSVYQCSDYPQ